ALAVGLLPRRRVAERDVGVERCVLQPRRRLDRGDDLAGYAELREAAKRGLLVGAEVAHGLEEPGQALLNEVLGIAADEEVRARLQADEAGVAADERVHRRPVAVPRADDELEIVELPLGLLRSA